MLRVPLLVFSLSPADCGQSWRLGVHGGIGTIVNVRFVEDFL